MYWSINSCLWFLAYDELRNMTCVYFLRTVDLGLAF